MIYEDFKGLKLSALGMGAMRLPTIDGDDAKIDTAATQEMVDYALSHGVNYCNARIQQEGLTPAYTVSGDTVSWDRSANGYRLPTEAEWEYACRAGTTTPFSTETSISAEESNYWGSYPYLIEDNYFSQGNLETQARCVSEYDGRGGQFHSQRLGPV